MKVVLRAEDTGRQKGRSGTTQMEAQLTLPQESLYEMGLYGAYFL